MRHFLKLFMVLLITSTLIDCDSTDDKHEEEVKTGVLDATRMVAMGNSLTAGVIDGGWSYDGLQHSFATQIARQMYGDGRVGDDPAEHQFLLGKIRDPGNPVPAKINAIEQLGEYEDGTPVLWFDFTAPEMRLNSNDLKVANYDADPNFNNLAVPGFMGLDVFKTNTIINGLGYINPLYVLPLRNRGTQLEQALEIDPTLVILWVGNNEVLRSAMSGGTNPPYPPQDTEDFSELGFQSVLNELLSPYDRTDTRIILGTVPDVTSIPFVTEVGVIKSDGTKGFIIRPEEGEVWKDTLTFYGTTPDGDVRAVSDSEYILLDWLLMNPYNENPIIGTESHPLPDELWLTDSQQEIIHNAVISYNNAITEAANSSDNIAVADMYTFYSQIVASDGIDGYKSGLFGGLFSLDGVHPGKVGHAYIANEFIKVMNEAFGAQIALLNPREFETEMLSIDKYGIAHGQQNPAYQESKNMIMNSGQRRLP